ncbi:MAG: HEAT repeat domain-containing protein [Chloroflexi bacterium]|nr:HEAT repeat domain-containing protein [Chloroflexota bacterium]
MTSPAKEIIADIGNSAKPLLNSRLTELSNLSSQELELFRCLWSVIETERRRQIVYRLVALTEDNLEFNFESIFKYCLQDGDDEVRRQAIEGLWESEEASLINPLVNLLEQDSSEKVQAAAARALGKFAMLAEHNKLRPCHVSRIEEALLSVIYDKDKPLEVRRRALEAAAPLSLPQVKTAITEAYHSHNAGLKVGAVYAMGKNCDPTWLPILLKELGNSDAELRYEAARACGELEAEAAAPCLTGLVNDIDADVRIAAIQALGKIDSPQARECLEQCRDNPDELISQAAEQSLLELEAKENPTSFLI